MSQQLSEPSRTKKIQQLLTDSLSPESIEIIDESYKHIGHAGSSGGAGHFKVLIIAEVFSGKRAIARHQLIYKALESMMQTEIHALSIDAKAPGE